MLSELSARQAYAKYHPWSISYSFCFFSSSPEPYIYINRWLFLRSNYPFDPFLCASVFFIIVFGIVVFIIAMLMFPLQTNSSSRSHPSAFFMVVGCWNNTHVDFPGLRGAINLPLVFAIFRGRQDIHLHLSQLCSGPICCFALALYHSLPGCLSWTIERVAQPTMARETRHIIQVLFTVQFNPASPSRQPNKCCCEMNAASVEAMKRFSFFEGGCWRWNNVNFNLDFWAWSLV